MNRVYTITFTEGPSVSLVESTARLLTGHGVPVQDQGGQSVSFRIGGRTPEDRDLAAGHAASVALLDFLGPWELATGMGVHRRIVGTGGRA